MSREPLTANEIIACGGCVSGIRDWAAARKNDLPADLTFREIIKHGIPYEVAVGLNDGFLNRVIAKRPPEDHITAAELIRSGGCVPGMKEWFDRYKYELPQGLDFRAFIKHGMPLSVAEKSTNEVIQRALRNRKVINGR